MMNTLGKSADLKPGGDGAYTSLADLDKTGWFAKTERKKDLASNKNRVQWFYCLYMFEIWVALLSLLLILILSLG